MAAVTIHSDFGAQENNVCHCFHLSPIYLPWSEQQDIGGVLFLKWGLEGRGRRVSAYFQVSGIPSPFFPLDLLRNHLLSGEPTPHPTWVCSQLCQSGALCLHTPRDGELSHYEGSLFYCWRALTRRMCFHQVNWSLPPIHLWCTYLWPLWGHRTLWPSTLFAYSFIQ